MWTVTVGKDGEVNIPQEVMVQLGLNKHDYLSFDEDHDKSIIVNRVAVKRVLVETVSTFRCRYVVELREDEPAEYALDTVVMNEAEEFSQKYLDEIIISHRVVSVEELLQLCDEDNDYASAWTEDQKFAAFVTPLPGTVSKVTQN